MTDETTSEQKDALAAIGSALIIVQMAERMIKFCMQYVLQKDESGLTYDKLKSLQADEARRTLGYFLTQLRQRAEIDSTFDNYLREFLTSRNQLAHNLADLPGIGFDRPEDIEFTIKWAGKLSGIALHVHNVFAGLLRAWQHNIGMRDDLADNEFFQEIDTKFRPFVNQIFTAKSS